MKKINFISIVFSFAISLCLVQASFAWNTYRPYTTEVSGIISSLRACNFDKAMELSDSFVKLTFESSKAKQNKHLALLKGARWP